MITNLTVLVVALVGAPKPVVEWQGATFDGTTALPIDATAVHDLSTGTLAVWFRAGEPTPAVQPLVYFGTAAGGMKSEHVVIEFGHAPIYPSSAALYATISPASEGWGNSPELCFDTINAPPPGWHWFALVVSANGNTGYLDGRELQTRHYNFGDASTRRFLADVRIERAWLGGGFWGWQEEPAYFTGVVSRAAIWREPLTGDQIAALPEPACLMGWLLISGVFLAIFRARASSIRPRTSPDTSR